MPIIEIDSHRQVTTGVVCPLVNKDQKNLVPQARLEEAVGLALAINLNIVYQDIIKIREIKPSTYFSQGILDKLQIEIQEKNIELLIIDSSISPIQQRNLEKKLKLKVIDRTALILEIFGERAQTKEGKLQVELAHLSYQRSRLVRSWTHLERQRGGAGFLGGPGETQIELDRRIIDNKIIRIKKDLEKVRQTRQLQRHARKKVPYPIVALVGYTNAGKSSIFNRLSSANVFAEDLLFATLDNTMRKIKLPSGREAILTDTVGFISDLPHELVMAFRATLEEVMEADLIIHVRDVSNENNDIQKQDVINVLKCIGLTDNDFQEKYIEVFNKIDLLSPEGYLSLQKMMPRLDNTLAMSASNGEGTETFLNVIDKKLSGNRKKIALSVDVSQGALIAWIYRHAEVLKVQPAENKMTFEVIMEAKNFDYLNQHHITLIKL